MLNYFDASKPVEIDSDSWNDYIYNNNQPIFVTGPSIKYLIKNVLSSIDYKLYGIFLLIKPIMLSG